MQMSAFNAAKLNRRYRCMLFSTALAGFLTVSCPSMAFAVDSQATPTGESVIGGSVSFSRPEAGRLDVTQSSQRAVINWDSFDIGEQATTTFHQPGASALVVNRVIGSSADPTQILGTLNANGRVMVLDRNGILFGEDAVINVGGIIASTGSIDDSSIMGGATEIVLDNFGDAVVENRGGITVNGAGLAALVAPTVRNGGTISARLGRVELAAGGQQVTVDFYGDNLVSLALSSDAEQALVDNTGRVAAEGGTIAMTTGFASNVLDSVINMSGVADASSARRNGGQIILRGGNVNLQQGGELKAGSDRRRGGNITITAREDTNVHGAVSTSGSAKAGNIIINGGGGNRSVIGESALVEANSARGHGGDIEIGADGGFFDIHGDITSSGRSGGGNINIENGDNPVTIGDTANILSEARHSGSGGDISISSGEGDQVIGGDVRTIGKRGGNIRVSSRSGIDVLEGGVLETRSTKYRGRDINLFVSEGDINHEGLVSSSGRTGGGTIALNTTRVFSTEDSLIESRSTETGRGGTINVQSETVHADGIWDVSGEGGGGNITINAFSDIHGAGQFRADAIQKGNGGKVLFNSTGGTVTLSGDIFARGGAQSGNGGTVTFSVPNTLEPGASVDVSAPNGREGEFNH